jgi:hypothetical protein
MGAASITVFMVWPLACLMRSCYRCNSFPFKVTGCCTTVIKNEILVYLMHVSNLFKNDRRQKCTKDVARDDGCPSAPYQLGYFLNLNAR